MKANKAIPKMEFRDGSFPPEKSLDKSRSAIFCIKMRIDSPQSENARCFLSEEPQAAVRAIDSKIKELELKPTVDLVFTTFNTMGTFNPAEAKTMPYPKPFEIVVFKQGMLKISLFTKNARPQCSVMTKLTGNGIQTFEPSSALTAKSRATNRVPATIGKAINTLFSRMNLFSRSILF